MGFQLPKRVAVLTFEGGDYDGAEVRVRLDQPISLFISLIEQLNQGEFAPCCDGLAQVLDSWNIERDDGLPVPATREGIEELPLAFIVAVLREWIKAQVTPQAPLAGPSANGVPPPVPPVPTVPLSKSPGN